MSTTINFYNQNAKRYNDNTFHVDFIEIQNRFLRYLPVGAYILDFGCGSGRDTKDFLEQGYRVEPVDGSEELCKIAEKNIKVPVRNMQFQELDAVEMYDGIWACASILHLPRMELLDVLKRMGNALKPEGIIYTSFKYGEESEERNGRHFTNYTEETFGETLEKLPELQIKEQWISSDVRENRGGEQWLNLILEK